MIKGQKEHHQQLVKKIRTYIRAHPADFGRKEGEPESEEADDEEVDSTKPEMTRRGTGSSVDSAGGGVSGAGGGDVMTLGRYAREKPQELAALVVIGGLAMLILGMLMRPTVEADVVIKL